MKRCNIILIINLLVSSICLSQDSTIAAINKKIDSAHSIILKHPKDAIKIAHWAINASKQINYNKGVIEGNILLSDIKYYEGDVAQSLEMSNFLIDLATEKDSIYLKELYYNRALANFELNNHFEAINDVYTAFSIKENQDDVYHDIQKNILLSDIHEDLGNIDDAITISKASYHIATSNKDSSLISYTSGILAEKFLAKQQSDSAYKYLTISKRTNTHSDNYALLNKLNYHYNISKYYLSNNALEKALYHAKQVYKLEVDKKDHTQKINFLFGEIYFALKDYKNATLYFEKIITNLSQNEAYILLADAHYHLSKIYYSQGKKDKAYQFLDKCRVFKDSAQQRDNAIRISHISSKYESEKKDNELNKQELQINIQNAELFKKQQYNIIMSLSLLLAILVIIITLYANTLKLQKKKAEQIIADEKLKTKDAFIKGEETERKQLSIELHDGINARLSALKYYIVSEEHNTAIQDHFKASILEQLDNVVNHIRVISNNLSPSALLHFNLSETLQYYCNTLNSLTPSITISFMFVGDPIRKDIPEELSTIVYRIVQELLNNSINHSQADDIIVQITHKNQLLTLTIEDNGKGFDINNRENYGLGLKNIKSRADYINARFDIVSDNKGTSTCLEIDLSNQ